MTPSKQIPLAGDVLPIVGKQLQKIAPPSTFWSPHYPQSAQYLVAEVSKAFKAPVRIIVSGRRVQLRVSRSIPGEVKSPFVSFNLLGWFLAHVSDHKQGVLSWVTNVLSRTTK